ncbi:major facilitator superfamily domain-containing protein, partial [Glomus cerebriforme]
LLPIILVSFFVACLDKSNIGNARLAGLEKDLNLSDQQYQIVLALFFVGEVVMKIPSNLLLHKYTPSVWIPFTMFLWSIITCCMAAVKNFEELCVARLFLGLTEAGMLPGIMYLLSMWYNPEDLATRLTIFYSGGALAGAFGGFISFIVTGNLDEVFGLEGWRWLLLVEGTCSLFTSIVAYFLLPDFPSTAKFLTTHEKNIILNRLETDPNKLYNNNDDRSSKEFSKDGIILTFSDWKTYYMMIMKAFSGIVLNSIALHLPTLINSMIFDTLKSQLLTVPPYIFACGFSLLMALHSDKMKERPIHLSISAIISLIGFIILGTSNNAVTSYLATFLCTSGMWSLSPILLTWVTDIFAFPQEKRLVTQAMVLTLSNLS